MVKFFFSHVQQAVCCVPSVLFRDTMNSSSTNKYLQIWRSPILDNQAAI